MREGGKLNFNAVGSNLTPSTNLDGLAERLKKGLMNPTKSEDPATEETIRDTFLDMRIYSGMGLIAYEDFYQGGGQKGSHFHRDAKPPMRRRGKKIVTPLLSLPSKGLPLKWFELNEAFPLVTGPHSTVTVRTNRDSAACLSVDPSGSSSVSLS